MGPEEMLESVRTALGRRPAANGTDTPPPRIRIPQAEAEPRIDSLFAAVSKLAGKVYRADSAEDARKYIAALVSGCVAVASNAQVLRDCGITALPEVRSGFGSEAELRAACASADVGITGANYALADTGTLVLFSSRDEARMVSLLPPVHAAVVARDRILTGLDELLTVVPHPAEVSSSMVLITGPSRTADIEQILVRGVHGPGEIHIVVV